MTTPRIRTLSGLRALVGLRSLIGVGALAGSLALPACSLNRVELDGVTETESRVVSDFTGLEFNGTGTVLIAVGPEASLSVTADTAILPRLRTRVSNGILSLDGLRWENADESSVVYEVTVRSLESVEFNGEGRLDATGIEAQGFGVEFNGDGRITLSGRTGTLRVAHNGDGSVAARGFEADDVSVELTGSGEVDVMARRTLAVDLSGDGNVTYGGSPSLSTEISGSGRVVQAD